MGPIVRVGSPPSDSGPFAGVLSWPACGASGVAWCGVFVSAPGRRAMRVCVCPDRVARVGAWCAVCNLNTVGSTALAPGPGQVAQRVCQRSRTIVSKWYRVRLPHGCRPPCAQHTRRFGGIARVGRCGPHWQHLTIVCVCVPPPPGLSRSMHRCRVGGPCKWGKGPREPQRAWVRRGGGSVCPGCTCQCLRVRPSAISKAGGGDGCGWGGQKWIHDGGGTFRGGEGVEWGDRGGVVSPAPGRRRGVLLWVFRRPRYVAH